MAKVKDETKRDAPEASTKPGVEATPPQPETPAAAPAPAPGTGSSIAQGAAAALQTSTEHIDEMHPFLSAYIEGQGVPEHIANLQTSDVAEGKAEGDVTSIGYLPEANKISITTVGEDGTLVTEEFPCSEEDYLEFEEILQGEDWQAEANAKYAEIKAANEVPDEK